MRNLELKARLSDLPAAAHTARALGAAFAGDLRQIDTYFVVPQGRLKLREIELAREAGQPAQHTAELIFYRRPEDAPTRWSDYYTAPVDAPTALRDVLGRAYGVRQQIIKTRRLYLYHGARIHLDQVAALGDFIEFEVPTTADLEAARAVMRELMTAFNLTDDDALRTSYGEMVSATRS